MLGSILAGVGGIGLAFYMYRLKPHLPAIVAERLTRLASCSINTTSTRSYIGGIVKPTLAFSRGVLLGVVDLACIDGVVNGVPRAIGVFSEKLRLIQDGQVSHYLAWMGGGARWRWLSSFWSASNPKPYLRKRLRCPYLF